ncbi:MAG: FecR domain-containing protein, partial [Gluconacetobacter liquefaciens]
MALAACVVLGVSLQGRSLLIWWQASACTPVGEIRTIMLADGSRVQLDSDSAIAGDDTPGQRCIRLLKGEAAFTVAARPAAPRPPRGPPRAPHPRRGAPRGGGAGAPPRGGGGGRP